MNAPRPMLAGEFSEDGTTFPVLVQPKLDGFRCLARLEESGWVLYSRTGKVLPLPLISEALKATSTTALGLTLDGELYIHGRGFQHLTSSVRQAARDVEFHVFDIVSPEATTTRLEAVAGLKVTGPIKRVAFRVATQMRDLERLYAEACAAGYEGVMVRDPKAAYEHRRSWSLLKLKPSFDAEFMVVGYLSRDSLLPVLTVRNDLTRATFNVVFPGLIHEPEECVGKVLTLRFAGRTDSLLPRHAVAVRFRPDHDVEPG